jgi:antirestriction protein ArdC
MYNRQSSTTSANGNTNGHNAGANDAIYLTVRDRIIEQLEKGVIPWQKDWADACISYTSRKGYRGINALLLDRPGEYLTFHQVQELGGKVKKGASSYPVVFYKFYAYKQDDGTEKLIPRPCKYYRVFHLEDTEGIPSKLPEKQPAAVMDIDHAETIVQDYINREGVKLHYSAQNRAFYCSTDDSITMPTKEQFQDQTRRYGVLFHEMTHSTGHARRLAREGITEHHRFGDQTYSREELVAEMGAAMMYSLAGLGSMAMVQNSAAYIQSWLQAIRNAEPSLITKAANAAQKAADFILGRTFEEQEEGAVNEATAEPAPAADPSPSSAANPEPVALVPVSEPEPVPQPEPTPAPLTACKNLMVYAKHQDESRYSPMDLSTGKNGVALMYATLIPESNLQKLMAFVDKLRQECTDFSFQIRYAGTSKVAY